MDELIKLMRRHKPGYRLDLGDASVSVDYDELRKDDVVFVAVYPGRGIPNSFNDHYEMLGCESMRDEPYIRGVIRMTDPHQRTLLGLQMEILDKTQILGRKNV